MNSPIEDKEMDIKVYLLNEAHRDVELGTRSHFSTASSASKKSINSSPAQRTPSTTQGYPTPPGSASPTQSSFHHSNPFSPSYRKTTFADSPTGSVRRSLDEPSKKGKGLQRASSLSQRFPGDMSHRPLDQIRKETKAAHRSPHLRKKAVPGADSIDVLDASLFGGAYHHEGPYDATLLSRNLDPRYSPVEAVKHSNAEALRATPRENIRDALDKRVPLQGTAVIPPGMSGIDGRRMSYEEGADLMREPDAAGGAYKRWDHIKYLPEDLKGKGEPSYTIEKGLKGYKYSRSGGTLMPDGSTAYEMQPQSRPSASSRQRSRSNVGSSSNSKGSDIGYSQYETDMRRSNTTGNKLGEGLKKRFGTLRRKNKDNAVEA